MFQDVWYRCKPKIPNNIPKCRFVKYCFANGRKPGRLENREKLLSKLRIKSCILSQFRPNWRDVYINIDVTMATKFCFF